MIDNIEELLSKLSRPTYIYRMNHSMSQPHKKKLTTEAKREIHDAVMEYAYKYNLTHMISGGDKTWSNPYDEVSEWPKDNVLESGKTYTVPTHG